MAWTSLSSRLASLPLVLAGPMVRNTTSNSVSIWIALKESRDLELIISKKDNNVEVHIGTGSASTISLGKNLHIAVITADGLILDPDNIYFYDIRFGPNDTLASNGILSKDPNGISKITYGLETKPSFILPSANMAKLKIVHASCRKPHGASHGENDVDGFIALDKLLNDSIHSADTRPQQLYLTGDQIYSDDVSDLLLFMLRDSENSLLGWPVREQLPSNPNSLELSPLHRLRLITNAGFTCGDVGKSHLLRLGEFYSMYLFVWSNEFWPTESEHFPSYDQDYSYASDNEEIELKGEYTREKYVSKIETLLNFSESIIRVRKILANISSYMIFDDHEITDDWYLNRQWYEDVNKSQDVNKSRDGNRIIQNGLSAFAVFQAWGNTPERYEIPNSNEKKLLNNLVLLNEKMGRGENTNAWDEIKELVIPDLSGDDLVGGIDWSYSIDTFSKFNVIVLNSRTQRHHPDRGLKKEKNHSGLISRDSLISQIRNALHKKKAHHEFTLLIAPAPVFGLKLMEELIQPLVAKLKDAFTGDTEAWILDRTIFELLLKELAPFKHVLILSGDVHYSFSTSVDYWLGKKGPNEKIAKFVNLTASSLKNSEGGAKGPLTLASAVNKGIVDFVFPNFRLYENLFLGWNTKGKYIRSEIESDPRIESLYMVDGGLEPHVWALIPKRSSSKPGQAGAKRTIREWFDDSLEKPDWQYRIKLHSDGRAASERELGTIPTVTNSNTEIGKAHQKAKFLSNSHTMVGENSIGEITFVWGPLEEDKKVIHKIWSKKTETEKFPFTIHVVDFGVVSETAVRPSEIGKLP